MEAPLEIRYAGVVIGRAQEVRSAEANAPSFFLPVRDPMPVGTVLRLRAGDHETPVRVVRAIEVADAAACGMQVRTIGESEEVAPEFIPPPAVVAEKIKAGTPTSVVEIDVARMQAESTAAETAAPAKPPAIITIPAPAPVTAPAKRAAESKPADPVPSPSGEIAAVPEAVPVAIGSSMTGALVNATESVPISEPEPVAPAPQSVPAIAPTSQPPDSASAENSQPGNGSATAPAPEEDNGVDVEMGEQTTAGDLPPARPIAGPSGRRKTKRRR